MLNSESQRGPAPYAVLAAFLNLQTLNIKQNAYKYIIYIYIYIYVLDQNSDYVLPPNILKSCVN